MKKNRAVKLNKRKEAIIVTEDIMMNLERNFINKN